MSPPPNNPPNSHLHDPLNDPLPNPPVSHRMSYTIGRGEQGVLTFEPYKSHLLPHWRFRTVPIAQTSSAMLFSKFLAFHEVGDFVGMDMCRKFIQMGMTRSKRYANFKGGRKYDEDGGERQKGVDHEGKREKEECSKVFRECWESCKAFEGYAVLRREWEERKREWIRGVGVVGMGEEREKREGREIDEIERPKSRGRKRAKVSK